MDAAGRASRGVHATGRPTSVFVPRRRADRVSFYVAMAVVGVLSVLFLWGSLRAPQSLHVATTPSEGEHSRGLGGRVGAARRAETVDDGLSAFVGAGAGRGGGGGSDPSVARRAGCTFVKSPGGDCAPSPACGEGGYHGFLELEGGGGGEWHPPHSSRPPISGSAGAGSGCLVSLKYKFIYVHVLKSAGSTLKWFFGNGLCGEEVTRPAHPPCSAGTDVLEVVSCHTAFRNHPDFFSFSFVRNPFGRAFSGYSMAKHMRSGGGGEDEPFPLSFDAFAARPEAIRAYSRTDAVHWKPQTDFLLDANHCPTVSYIGKVEDFARDMPEVLARIASPEMDAYYAEHGMKSSKEKDNTFGERAVADAGGSLRDVYTSTDTVHHVSNRYSVDFAFLGYDPDTVPLSGAEDGG